MSKMTYGQLTAAIAQLAKQQSEMETFLTGVIAILGRDEVLQAGRDFVEEQVKQQEQALDAQVKYGVETGWLKSAPVSGLKSLVVGVESTPERPHMRMQLIPGTLHPTQRGVYLGREVGEEFDVPGPNGTLVHTKVTEIYEIDEARRAEVIAEEQAKAKAAEEAALAQGAAAEPKPEAPVEADASGPQAAGPAPAKPRVSDPDPEPEAACTLKDPCFEEGCPVCGDSKKPVEGPARGRAAGRAKPPPDDGSDLV